MLDGRPANGHFWVYYGGLSDVAYRLKVTDVQTGEAEIYDNPPGRLVSRADTVAFTAEPPAPLTAKLSPVPGGGPGSGLPPPVLLRRGPEFQANVTTAGVQYTPSVALRPDGRFMVTWSGEGQTPDGDALGRFYDAQGRPLTGEVSLNTSPGTQYGARAAASPTGEYMAVWFDEDHLYEDRIVGRVFDAAGQPLGDEFAISSPSPSQGYLSIVTDPAGGFLVAWFDGGSSNPTVPSSVRWQRFNRLGQRVGVEKAFNRHGLEVNVAASPAGGFVLVWTEYHPVYISETDVLALVLDAEGRPLDDQAIRVTTADGVHRQGRHVTPVPVFHSDGGFSVVWQTSIFAERGAFARRYDAQGQPDGPVTSLPGRVSDSPPALAALPSGETLMLWFDSGQIQDPDSGVFGQIFDSSWNPVGGRSRINTYTEYPQFEPALAVSGNEVVAAWSSGLGPSPILPPPGYGLGTQDGDHLGVFGQRFTLATCALDETQLCLGGRFQAEVRFTDPRVGQQGVARAIPLTSDTGAFWFFGEENAELVLKVLDGRTVNGHFWIYYGALSDVQYTITVTDTLTNQTKTYNNPRGRLASRADIGAF